jgi:hypothetical protein
MGLARPDSEESVANLALGKCHEDEIASFNDDVNRARVVRRHFGLVRDALLRRFDWNFAADWVAPAAAVGLGLGTLDTRYIMPTDCLAIRAVDGLEDDEWESTTARITDNAGVVIEAMVLVREAGDGTLVKYTRRVETVRLWDPMFTEAFVCLLAAACAPELGRSTSQAAAFRAEAEELLVPLARAADSKEKAKSKATLHLPLNSWLWARRGLQRPR